MEIINKLIQEGVLPHDIGTQLKDEFDLKVKTTAEGMLKEHESRISKSLTAFMTILKEKFEKDANNEKEKLEKKLDEYLNIVVDNFIKDSKDLLATKVDEHKINALDEIYHAMCVIGGVEAKQISEQYEEDLKTIREEIESKSVDEKSYNALMDSQIELQKENNKLRNFLHFSKIEESNKFTDLDKEKLNDFAISICDKPNDEFNNLLNVFIESLQKTNAEITKKQDVFYEAMNKRDKVDLDNVLFNTNYFKS